ncbi:MAG: hypothetical protein RIM33_05550 [Alphaproteobacteria bacterium]
MIFKYVREQKPREANRRRYKRHTIHHMQAELDKSLSAVLDISEVALRVSGGPPTTKPGSSVFIRLLFPTRWRHAKIPVYGKVLRKGQDGMIVTYSRPVDDWRSTFRKLIRAGTTSSA